MKPKRLANRTHNTMRPDPLRAVDDWPEDRTTESTIPLRPGARKGEVWSCGSGRVGSGRVGSGRVGSGRVGSGRVGSGRVGSGRVGSGRVGSGRVGSGRVGSGRVGSGRVGSGRVGSGRVGSGRVGSGRVGSGRVGSGRMVRGGRFSPFNRPCSGNVERMTLSWVDDGVGEWSGAEVGTPDEVLATLKGLAKC